MTRHETRRRILRWSRVESLAAWMGVTGIAVPVATFGIGLLLVDPNSDGGGFLPMLGSAAGLGVLLLVASVALEVHARQQLLEARFADGYLSVGTVDEVIDVPTEGESLSTLMITLTSPTARPRIRRELDSTMHPSGPSARLGGTVLFRHNTLDPNDLEDVLFVRFL